MSHGADLAPHPARARSTRWPASAERGAALALIVAATAAIVGPIFAAPDRIPAGHDYALAVTLAEGYAEGLEDGYLYPRWVSRANAGHGIPALIGYPPLGAMLVGTVRVLTGETAAAFRIVLCFVHLIGGLSFFLFARRFARPLVAGIGAALYVLAPYHVMVLYHRFAFAEIVSQAWLPLVLHFGLSLRARPTLGSALGLAASFALVLASHVVVAQMVVVGLGVVVLFASRPLRHPRRALAMGGALGLAALLAGAYVIPVLASRELVHWDAQYAPDRALPFVFAARGDEFTTLLELTFLVQAGCLAPLLPMLWRGKHRALVTCLAAGLFATLLHTAATLPLWRYLPGMQYLLYPYRFGLLAALFCPLGVVFLTERRPALGALAALASALALLALPTLYDHPRYLSLRGRDLAVWNQEHIPRTVGSIYPRAPTEPRASLYGAGEASVLEWRSHTRRIRADVEPPGAQLRVATWYFPGWEAQVDGVPRSIGPEAGTGLILVDLGPGAHEITLSFVDTPDRVIGAWVSGLAWLGFLALLVVAARGHLRRRREAARAAEPP